MQLVPNSLGLMEQRTVSRRLPWAVISTRWQQAVSLMEHLEYGNARPTPKDCRGLIDIQGTVRAGGIEKLQGAQYQNPGTTRRH